MNIFNYGKAGSRLAGFERCVKTLYITALVLQFYGLRCLVAAVFAITCSKLFVFKPFFVEFISDHFSSATFHEAAYLHIDPDGKSC